MRAFNNRQTLKDNLVKEVKWHYDQDHIKQGTYGNSWESRDEFRGCAVGCTLRSYMKVAHKTLPSTGEHEFYKKIGIPEYLADLEERIFERTHVSFARSWPIRFLEAIPVGANLEPVINNIVVRLLSEQGHTQEHICAVFNPKKQTHENLEYLQSIIKDWKDDGWLDAETFMEEFEHTHPSDELVAGWDYEKFAEILLEELRNAGV